MEYVYVYVFGGVEGEGWVPFVSLCVLLSDLAGSGAVRQVGECEYVCVY
jgi:hypothetical protein